MRSRDEQIYELLEKRRKERDSASNVARIAIGAAFLSWTILTTLLLSEHDNKIGNLQYKSDQVFASVSIAHQRGIAALAQTEELKKRIDVSDAKIKDLQSQINGRVYPVSVLAKTIARGTYVRRLALDQGLPVIAAQQQKNVDAMLETISVCEGTQTHGYHTHVGGGRISSLKSDFPCWINSRLGSNACGKYQIISPTWQRCKRALGMHFFTPSNQRKCAIWLMEKAGVLDDVKRGDLDAALLELSKIWASLPPDRYGQHPKTKKYVLAQFQANGGSKTV